MKGVKIVRLVMKMKMFPRPAAKQKLESTGIEEVHPRKNTAQLVRVVIVSEEPTLARPSFIRFSALSMGLVWSMEVEMRKVLSTPIPTSRKGRRVCMSEALKPK